MGRTVGALAANGFYYPEVGFSTMRRLALAMLLIPLLVSVSSPALAVAPPPMPGSGPTDEDVLAWNETSSGILVKMYAEPGPTFYENELQHLRVVAELVLHDPSENVSVQVLMGMDGLREPEHESSAIFVDSSDTEDDIFLWRYMGASNVTPALTSRHLLATLTHGNETVNLSYGMTVEPARIILGAELVTPPNFTGYEELTWTDVQIKLTNAGGGGVTGLVVDVRYAGRIASTHHVNLVPPNGNTTIMPRLRPLFGNEVLEVHIVSGPVASGPLANVSLNVTPRPILDIVSVRVDRDEVVSGERVNISAMVTNRGNGTSTGQLVELMVDGSVVANSSIVGLAPGNGTLVHTKWRLTDKGTHTMAARAEGDEFAAKPVTVQVKGRTPGLGALATLMAVGLLSLVARRSMSGGRA